MTREQAKGILMLYRPGTDDADNPEMHRAIEVARQDPDLGRWFDNHCHFQKTVRAKLMGIEAPQHLKTALLACQRIVPLRAWWQEPVWLTAAAAIILLLLFIPFHPRAIVPDRFVNFREMMVSTALKSYSMDWETNDAARLRQLIASKGAPGDYQVPPQLNKLKLTGGAALAWRSNPVSMVCYDEGNKRMLFLFVMRNPVMKGGPQTGRPELAKISSYLTASWRSGDKTYLLVGPDEPGFRDYF